MKSTPFNPEKDIATLPFSREVCLKAEELKKHGLKWSPHVGCFVWDKNERIEVPSPFPHNIYFILNLGHFLRIFGSIEAMQADLVWLPTWHQSRLICQQLQIDLSNYKITENAEKDLIALYERIVIKIKT